MHRHAPDVSRKELDLAGMQAAAHLEPAPGNGRGDRSRRANAARRAVEREQRAVAGRPLTHRGLRATLDLRPWQWDLMAEAFADALDLDPAGTPTGHDEQDA